MGPYRIYEDLFRIHYHKSKMYLIPPSFFPGLLNTLPHQKSILAMSTDDPDTHGLWFWTQRSWMHRPQVDDSFAIQGKNYY